MKKLIVSKTIIFIFIMVFVTVFQNIFGAENVLIAVTTVVAMLMLLERDLTIHPLRNLFLILALNLLQGIFGYVSSVNMWLGIPLNFIAMFIVGYFFTYNLKKPLFIAFGLQYLFILTTPIVIEQLPMRLSSLAAGAVIIIGVQLLANKNKLEKAGNKYLLSICDQLIKKIDGVQKNESNEAINKTLETAIKEFRKIIYYRRFQGYYLTNESRLKLKITVCLEKLNLIIDRSIKDANKKEKLGLLQKEIEYLKEYISSGSTSDQALKSLKDIKMKSKSVYVSDLIGTLEILYELLEDAYSMERKELNNVEKMVEIPWKFKSSYNHIQNLNRGSVRYTYAVRVAVVITISAFVIDYFQLTEGKWMIYTVFSVTQPYAEQALFRFKERIIGTLIGASIFIVLFTIFTDLTSRSMIVLLVGYFHSYAVAYRNVVWTVTLIALGTAALTGDPTVLTVNRVFFVLLGIIIGMLGNKFILPHSVQTGTKNLVNMYKETSKLMMIEVYSYLKNRNNTHTINNLFAVSSLIEDRILLNNETLEYKESQRFLEQQRKLNHAIYELFVRVEKNKIEDSTVKLILEDINQIFTSSNQEFDHLMEILKEKVGHLVSIEDQIIVKDVLRIFKGFKKNCLTT